MQGQDHPSSSSSTARCGRLRVFHVATGSRWKRWSRASAPETPTHIARAAAGCSRARLFRSDKRCLPTSSRMRSGAPLRASAGEMHKRVDSDRVDERHATAVKADLPVLLGELGLDETADLFRACHVELAAQADHQAAAYLDAGDPEALGCHDLPFT